MAPGEKLLMGEELTIIRRPVAASAPTMRDLFAVLFRQRRIGLISFLTIFLAAILYGVFAPSYESHMKVMVRRGRVDAPVTPTPSPSPMFQREEITEEELNSQVELLKDDEILAKVVQATDLTSRTSWIDNLLGGNDEVRLARAVRRMTRRLKVEPVRKSNLIDVTYSSSDPAQAASVLHSLAHAFLERQEHVRRPSGEVEFFDKQVVLSRRGLLDAEFHLMDFSSDQGVVSAAQERDLALQKLSDAEANNHQTQVSIAETRRRIQGLEAKLQSLPERVITTIRNSDNPQLAEKMKSKLLELQLKRTELLTKFQPSYRWCRKSISKLRKPGTASQARKRRRCATRLQTRTPIMNGQSPSCSKRRLNWALLRPTDKLQASRWQVIGMPHNGWAAMQSARESFSGS